MKERATIAVDIDDVLSATVEGLVEFSNKRWGMQLKAADFTEEFAVFWNVSIDEALLRIEELLASGAYGRLRHFEESVKVLQRLKRRYNLVAATSRRSVLKPETDQWLEDHFPGIFESGVHYAGIWDGPHDIPTALKQTKAELCRELGADYLIDDQLKHCLAAADAGITALLFGDYRWNEHDDLPANVHRVADWPAVERYFDAQG